MSKLFGVFRRGFPDPGRYGLDGVYCSLFAFFLGLLLLGNSAGFWDAQGFDGFEFVVELEEGEEGRF